MIPINVKVAGVAYDVFQKDYIEIESDRNYQGACNYIKTEILLLSELGKERKEQIFVHELLHAVFYEAGYEEQDEEMIDRVSKVLYQVMKDNKLNFG